MAIISLFPEKERGRADHGWLKANFSFSFSNYYNPQKIHFGVLRVLNDDMIEGGMGFGSHPHDNMEIITIPLSGALAHKDNLGNTSVIQAGEVQVMSAGTGVFHSEFNHQPDKNVNLFQIWLFPNKRNVEPRYDQLNYTSLKKENELYQILSPSSEDQGVWIHQDAWFYLGDYDKDKSETYRIRKSGNGVYAMVIEGSFEIEGQVANKRDAVGVSDADTVKIKALQENSKILFMDIPMELPAM